MAKPKLALIPAAQGDKFYSVLPSDGVGDFDFTRASTGTRIAPTGLIEEVASGDSRLNYDLLNGKVVNCPHYLLEPARTNLITYSEDFSDSSWIKQSGSVSSNQTTSPDGGLNADKLIDGSTSGVLRKQGISLLASDYTFSVFAKKDDRDYLLLITSFGNGTFDLTNGVVVSSTLSSIGNIEEYKNEWYKCSLTFTATASSPFFRILTDGSQPIINGVSGIYIWGAQLEQSSYLTSYIPTNGTAITRAAESADGSGDAATFNDSEGVLMAEIAALANDGTYRQISINDSSTNNRITLDFTNTDNQIRSFISFNGTSQALMVGSTIATNQSKAAVSYKSNDFSLWLNGFKVDTDTNGSVPTGLNNLNFDNGGGANDFYGKTREVQYFDSALTDAQLETLTSWTSLQEMITSQLYTNY